MTAGPSSSARTESTEAILGRIASLAGKDAGALVDLLAEQSPVYDGRGTGDAERIRAHLFAALAGGPLPAAALPVLLEELETGRDPAATAAAAMALRDAGLGAAEAEPVLLKALRRLAAADRPFALPPGLAGPCPRPGGTALQQLVLTIAELPGAGSASREALASLAADPRVSSPVREEATRALARLAERTDRIASPCCAASRPPPATPAAARDIAAIRLQDQAGGRLRFADFFGAGEPAALAFFYTRCMNPERCSLTVTKLARLQPRLAALGRAGQVRIGAISYDPAWDLPNRLLGYGLDRGFRFDERNRFLRTTGPIEPLRAAFDLGVGYGPSTVNRHRIELFLLDSRGAVARSFTRALWDEETVAEALAAPAGARRAGQERGANASA